MKKCYKPNTVMTSSIANGIMVELIRNLIIEKIGIGSDICEHL